MKYNIHIASTAQKLSKKSRKVSKNVALYVPDSFDPDVHLPEELRHLADYARYLLHRINVGRVHLRRRHALVYLKHDYLAKFMPRGTLSRIRDALEDAEVITVRKFCVPGEMCYGYRLCPPHDQGFSHYQPTTKPLVAKIKAWRAKEFREVRLPLHRDLRRYVKAIRIDEEAALASVHGTPFQRSAQVAMIERIVLGDYFTVADRFGRFHTNLTSLKATLRPFLRYRGSPLVNLDIANSQPMIFCLLLVNLLSNEKQLENLIDYSFPETSQPYHIEIDQNYLDSLHSPDFQEEEGEGGRRNSPILHANCPVSEHNILQDNDLQQVNNRQTSLFQNYQEEEEGEGGIRNSPILHANRSINSRNIMQDNSLQQVNNRQTSLSENYQEEEEGEGGKRNSPILHANEQNSEYNINQDNNLQRVNNRQTLPHDVIEFIRLCEQGVLYDDLMRRLGIPARRRKGFKRLFFSQVFFGKVKATGRVCELFARDFPTVYKAINDLKRKDYRQLAYLLQAHESKLMIDIICRKILAEIPGTFIGTIHDSILTTPDKADQVREIMVREFRRFGLSPTIRTEV
jgi:hypothetical protein